MTSSFVASASPRCSANCFAPSSIASLVLRMILSTMWIEELHNRLLMVSPWGKSSHVYKEHGDGRSSPDKDQRGIQGIALNHVISDNDYNAGPHDEERDIEGAIATFFNAKNESEINYDCECSSHVYSFWTTNPCSSSQSSCVSYTDQLGYSEKWMGGGGSSNMPMSKTIDLPSPNRMRSPKRSRSFMSYLQCKYWTAPPRWGRVAGSERSRPIVAL